MSKQNVEIVRRHHEAFIAGDREGTLEPLDPNIEFIFHSLGFDTARGHAEVEQAMRHWLGTWTRESYSFEPTEYRDVGNKVLVRFAEHGVGKGSHIEVVREAFQLWEVRNGKAVRCEIFVESAEALKAAGLSR